jgi:hypothetical protein
MSDTIHQAFLGDLHRLLKKYDARLELTDYESERCYSIWVFFNENISPLDLGNIQEPGVR